MFSPILWAHFIVFSIWKIIALCLDLLFGTSLDMPKPFSFPFYHLFLLSLIIWKSHSVLLLQELRIQILVFKEFVTSSLVTLVFSRSLLISLGASSNLCLPTVTPVLILQPWAQVFCFCLHNTLHQHHGPLPWTLPLLQT